MANEYLGECHALCFIENRKGISQIYPKVEEFIQFIYLLAKSGIKIQLHPFRLKQVIWKNALLELIRAMFMKNGCNSANNGSIRKILSPT